MFYFMPSVQHQVAMGFLRPDEGLQRPYIRETMHSALNL